MNKRVFFKNATHFALLLALTAAFLPSKAISQQAWSPHILGGHVPPAVARFHLHALSNLPETNQLVLDITLPLRNQQALDDLLQQIYDPKSPNYHHYLTPGQFTAQFGPSQQDYDAIVQFVRSNGLTVVRTYSNRTLVDIAGNVGSVEKAFHTTLRLYQHPAENRTFFAPDTDPAIDLTVPINHVDGLDNFIIPRPAIRPETSPTSGIQEAAGSGPGGEYMGLDFHAAYAPGVALNGAGQIVALFELDAYVSNDIAFYEKTNGLPITPLANILPNGTVHRTSGGSEEVSLDIEMAVSMATNLSKVIVYEAPNGNGNSVPDLLSRIAMDNTAKQISSSWLIGDSPSYETYYQQMAAEGQSFFQASGDDGAYYSGIPQWADDTNIITVGGTTLSTTGPGGSWSSETVWNQGNGASGGGTNFNGVPIPSWQSTVNMANNQGSTTLRNSPDVALTGDNIYVVYNNGQTQGVGGTSCAAPLWAAFTALVNQQALADGETTVGFINPAVYAIGLSGNYLNCFHDITTGNNNLNATPANEYFAATGYDLCTGWGTPNGSNLINALTAPPATLTITPGMGFMATGTFGGPFIPSSQTYSLTNIGGSSLNWSLSNTSSWLFASATNGTLAAGKGTNVTISISAGADSLRPGTYAATATFTNLSSNSVQSLSFALQVIEPLVVTPGAGFSASGAEGGPFTASEAFTLTNSGAIPLNWQAAGPVWLNLSPSNGTLAAQTATTVAATFSSAVNSLSAGSYIGQVSFADESSGTIQNRQFTLSIGQNIVLNGGFETGDFTDWTLNTNGSGTFVDLNNGVAQMTSHSGNYLAALGQGGSPGYISQTLPTVANQSYLLSLWFNSPNVSPNTPNQFIVSWNGVALYNQANIPPIAGWTNLQFIVTATGPATVLQFGQRDDPWYLGLDDVNVWPIPAPNIQNISRASGNTFSVTWNTLTNIQYQIQYSTNLLSTNWLNLNTYDALSSVLTVTNTIGTNPATFYRILELP